MSVHDAPRRAPQAEFSPRLPYRAVILALALLAGGLLFAQLVGLLLLVIVSVILAVALGAAATWLERLHIPRALGAVLTLAAVGAVIAAVLIFVVPRFVAQVNAFVAALPATARHFEHGLNHAFGLKPGAIPQAADRFVNRYTHHPTTLLGPLAFVGLTVVEIAGGAVVVLIGALYMAINPDPLIDGMLRLVPASSRDDARRTLERVRTAWLGWLRGVLIDMIVLGSLLFIGMDIVGVRLAIAFAVFSALMTVIPNYGSVISAVPPIAFALTRSVHHAVLVTVVYVVVNQIEGNLVLPLIMGRTAHVHPAVTAIGVLIAGALFGIIGLFVAVPLISLTLILVDELWVRPHGSPAAGGDPAPPRLAGGSP
ncbi:MAG TPA: AI-2E family transporter [Solirubrobacteraceae bacterium]|nr:AI-2E family transporter [Solirubrobacteraceae bacterium]